MELKDVVDVLESKGSKDFATLLKSQNTMRSLADHNLTIFAPTDEALNSRNLDYQESVSKVVFRVISLVDYICKLSFQQKIGCSSNTT